MMTGRSEQERETSKRGMRHTKGTTSAESYELTLLRSFSAPQSRLN